VGVKNSHISKTDPTIDTIFSRLKTRNRKQISDTMAVFEKPIGRQQKKEELPK